MKYSEKTFGQAEAIFNILGGAEAVDRILRGELEVKVSEKIVLPAPPSPPILTFVNTVELPARAKKFEVLKHFTKGGARTGRNARPSIYYIDPDFDRRFGAVVEEPTGPLTLAAHDLGHNASVKQCAQERGGEKVLTGPASIYALTALQPNGEKGFLLTNGFANLFKVLDIEGNERAVYVYWDADDRGWCVYEYSLESVWSAGRRFVSLHEEAA